MIWIDSQYAAIAAECGYARDNSLRTLSFTSPGRQEKVFKRSHRERETLRSQGFKAQVIEETTADLISPRRSQRARDKLIKSARRDKKDTPLVPFDSQKVIKLVKKAHAIKSRQSVNAGVGPKCLSARQFNTARQSTSEAVTTRYGRKIKQPERLGSLFKSDLLSCGTEIYLPKPLHYSVKAYR